MSEHCENLGEGLEYTLSAVLYHGGSSANSGHYVGSYSCLVIIIVEVSRLGKFMFYFVAAHICDSETGTWYKFNDESVEKIDNKKLKLKIEAEYGGKVLSIFPFQ